jgi:hypothetical protein
LLASSGLSLPKTPFRKYGILSTEYLFPLSSVLLKRPVAKFCGNMYPVDGIQNSDLNRQGPVTISRFLQLIPCAIVPALGWPALVCVAHEAVSSESIALTVCEVDTPAHAYAGREVTIEGWISHHTHGTELADPSCHPYGLPEDLLEIKLPTQYSSDSGIEEFANVIYGPDAAEHVGESVKCICSGKIEYASSGRIFLSLEKAQILVSKDGHLYHRI